MQTVEVTMVLNPGTVK